MENWKKPEAKKSPGTLRFEELQEKDKAYTITDEEALELVELKRLGRLAAVKKRGAKKAQIEAEIQEDRREANDQIYAEIRREQKRKEGATALRKAWTEGPARDIVDENGDVILNPEYPMKRIDLPPSE